MHRSLFGFQWHITDRCDQRCKHCYIHADPNHENCIEMDFTQICKTFDFCLQFCEKFSFYPCFYITGGDPLLHPDFWKLTEIMREHGLLYAVMGNPYHLNEKVCEELYKSGCTVYQMSIDGVRQTHDFIRRKGSFDETLEKIPILKKAGIKATIMTTVSGINIRQLPEIMDTVVEYGASVFAFTRYCPTDNSHENGIQPERYRDIIEKCDRKIKEFKQKKCPTIFVKKDHLWKLYDYEQGIINPVNKHGGCSCGKSQLTILPDGDIWACRRVKNSSVGNVYTSSPESVWLENMEYYRQYDKFSKCFKCELLNICRGCPAVSHSTTGNFYGKDPQCWKK